MSERKSIRFVELIVASLLGVIASKLFDAIYSTPIVSWADSWTRAFLFVIFFVGIAAFLYVSPNWRDVMHDIRNRRKKKQDKVVEKMKMTDEEYKQVIKELLERSKDMIYFDNMITKEQMEKFATTDEQYELHIGLRILGGDIRQILGRIRRKS